MDHDDPPDTCGLAALPAGHRRVAQGWRSNAGPGRIIG